MLDKPLLCAILAAALPLAACKSYVKHEQSVYPAPPPGHGAVYFYRAHDDDGDGVDFTIKEDGRAIGILADRTYTVHFAKPGRHFYSAATQGSDNPEREDGQFINVAEGENSYLQVLAEATTFSAKPRTFVAFEQQARPVIETLTYITPKEK